MHATDVHLTGLALLAPDEAQAWRRRVRHTVHPCGCKSGAAAVLVALVAWPIRVVRSGVPTTPLAVLWVVITYGFVVVGAAIAGKVAGIVVGRARHRWALRQLGRRLAAVDLQAGS
jgi:hypothetical protein